MRITNIQILCLILFAWGVNTRIGIRKPLDDGGIHPDDILEFQIKDYFDLSFAKTKEGTFGRLTVNVTQASAPNPSHSVGTVYDQFTPVTTLTYEEKTTLTFIKYLDEKSFVLFYDDNTVVYQEMEANGAKAAAGTMWDYKFKQLGADFTCQDAILWNKNTEILYTCYTKGKPAGDHTMWLIALKRDGGDLVASNSFTNTKTNPFTNRATLANYILDNGSSKEMKEYLVAYNQGRSHSSKIRNSGELYMFTVIGSDIEPLEEHKPIAIEFDGIKNVTLNAVYDMFNYRGRMMVSCKISDNEVAQDDIKLISCGYDSNSHKVECSSTKIYSTGIIDGFVASVDISGFLVQYDLTQRTVSTFQFMDDFMKDGWLAPVNSMEIEDVTQHGVDLAHNWVRRIEGNANNLAISWATLNNDPSSNGDDVATTLVSWTFEDSWTMAGYSGAINNEWLYSAKIDTPTVDITKLDSAWVLINGSDVDFKDNNVITITVSDQENTVSVSGTIFNMMKSKAKINLDFQAPYMDAFSDSIFHHPFDGDNWISGNGVRFNVTYNDTHFTNTEVFDSHEFTISFNPPARRVDFKSLHLAEGAAVIQLPGENLTFYQCDHAHGSKGLLCNYKYFIRTDENEMIQDEFFARKNMIGVWGSNFGVKTGDLATYIYIASLSEGVSLHKTTYASNSVAFTMDNDDNMYVAIANMDAGYVEIFKVMANVIGSWEKIGTIEANNVGYEYLCPFEIRFDPIETTTLHIMSACNLYHEHGVQRLISYAIPGFTSRLSGASIVIDTVGETGMVAPSFCPMGDHHIIHFAGGTGIPSLLYSIDKRQSSARYNYHLSDWGLDNIKRFDCFSQKAMFSIYGSDTANSFSLGTFWASHKYGNQKIVNYLQNDIDVQKWGGDIRSYAMKHVTAHYGFNAQNVPSYGMTFNNLPWIRTQVLSFPGYYETITPVGFNLTAKSGLFKKQISGVVNARIANISIGFTNRATWAKITGWIDLESYTRIDGPVESVELLPDASGNKLGFSGRKRKAGGMDGEKLQLEFDQYRGTSEDGVGLSIEGKHTTFAFVKNHIAFDSVGAYGVDTFDWAPSSLGKTDAKLILYHGINGLGDIIQAGVTDYGSFRYQSGHPLQFVATKLRVASLTNGRFVGFALDRWGTGRLSIIDIKFNPLDKMDKVTMNVIHNYEGVTDFDICQRDSSGVVHLYYTNVKSDSIGVADWSYTNNNWVDTELPRMKPTPDSMSYWLTDIAASADGMYNNIVVNTRGTRIYHQSVMISERSKNLKNGVSLVRFVPLDKYQNYDGMELYINDNFIVQKAYLEKPGLQHEGAVLVWKRFDTDGTLHTLIELPNSGTAENNRHPVAFYNHDVHGDTIAVGFGEPRHPLRYYSIQNCKIHIPEDYVEEDIDFALFNLKIQGMYSASVTVNDMMTGDTPTPPGPRPPTPGDGYPYWPFFAVLAFLLLAALVWFACSRKEDEVEDDEDAEYFSMQPESKVTDANAFETGLDDGVGTAGDTGLESAKPTVEDLGLN